MGKPNFKKVIIGLSLIIMACLLAVTTFYFLEVKPKMEARFKRKTRQAKIKTMKITEEAEVTTEEKKSSLPVEQAAPPKDAKQKTEKPAASAQPSQQAGSEQYDTAERNRREGTLWIDASTGNYVATLGSVQGVKTGDRLEVYDNEALIGSVEVKDVQGIVSFVAPENDAIARSGKKYFRVLKP